jgi:hypothetical protein
MRVAAAWYGGLGSDDFLRTGEKASKVEGKRCHEFLWAVVKDR